MMRLRRASVIVAFSLLTSTATAYAECAWVLWGNTAVLDGPKSLASVDPTVGYASKEECIRGLAATIKAAVASSTDQVRIIDDGPSVIVHSRQQYVIRISYTCLPDTVDPRRAKGK